MKLLGALLSIGLLASGCWCIVGGGGTPLISAYKAGFSCDDGHIVDSDFRCDGNIDCFDRTDERGCEYDDCLRDYGEEMFFCRVGRQCILPEFVCDGQNDCWDGFDEFNCTAKDPCPTEFFSCTDGSNCVPRSFMCDGHPECHDGSDESKETCHGTLHGYASCEGKFKCGAGLCLEDEKLVCDGKVHCPSGRDESPETCLSHPDCKKCTQQCKRHSRGATCGCNPGFELAADGGTCIDVDECARGLCSQICQNSEGSFKCGCRPGFKKVNGTRCENLDKATFVWYRGDHARGRYVVLDRDGKERKIRIPQTTAEHIPSSLMPPMAVDIDNGKLYIRVGNTLYSMHTEARRNARPALVPVLSPRIQMMDFAVDYATGNVYFTTMKGTSINICNAEGSCFPYISRRNDIVSRIQIVRLLGGTKVFWQEGSKIMAGSLDGSEFHQVFKVLNGEAIRYFVVDEQSEKMYLALTNLLEFDLATSRTKSLARLDFGLSGSMFWNMAVHDDVVLVQVVDANSAIGSKSKQLINKIIKIDRLTGDHLGPLETPAHLQLHSVRRVSRTPLQNACAKNKCSHVCAPDASSNGYKCLCPPGMHLDDDEEHNCIPQEGEEVIFFVNGTSVSTYVFEENELFLNSNFNLRSAPLAIATTLDMNLIVSSHHKLTEIGRNGSRKTYGVRDARAMVVDPIDDVLYAANEYELLAVNLKTSSVALIRQGVNIKHMDIDPSNRILFAETMDSKLVSMEIGDWHDTLLEKVPKPSDDGQRTWAFDPTTRTIQTEIALVIEKGYCDLVHDDEVGFDCHRQGWLLERCNHSTPETRLLARAGSPLGPLKGSACGSSDCEFCVSANGATLLEPVCVCPYGHELGSDHKSCTKSCGLQMLKCASDGTCYHQSTRCDGHNDCADGSDEAHCTDFDCHSNFKCLYAGNCISKKFVCDGIRDCSDGTDEEKCSHRNCTAAQFMCEDGKCMSRFKRCDGVPDCYHGDDEKNCPKVECKPNEFACGNKACIPQDWVCDSRPDCPDGEDEAECSNLKVKLGKVTKHNCDSKWIFCCKSGEQLPASMHCNGIDECQDRSDEANCTMTCAKPRFLCDNGACLAESEVCDGIPHCPNKADEHNCKDKCWQKDLFECRADGTCLPRDKICDGKRDCSDGEDETAKNCESKPSPPTNASCSADEFKCRSGQCIGFYQVCDGRNQCDDGSDEGAFCKKLDCKAAGCSQGCFAIGSRGVQCTCNKGYRLLDDGYSCDDIDECVETPEVCSQFCSNEKGTYKCFCAPGFIPNSRGECRVESGDALLIIVENGIIETIDKNKDRNAVLNLFGSHIGGIEYDAATGLIFVSDTDNDKIHRIPLNKANGQYKHEAYTQLKPGALAFDWVTGNLYFADHRPAIHVCNRSMAGAYCRILTEVDLKPTPGALPPAITSIALVPDEGIMFYAEASTGFIFRQNMDGTERTPFRWALREKRPLSLTVDHIHRTLYWVDAHSGSIESSNFKGEKIRRIATHLSFVRSFALFEDYLVFPEPSSEHWIIMHKQTGQIKSSKMSPLGRVSEVKIMHEVNQPHEINRCSKNPCQQMCLLKPHEYACACTDGQELSKDKQTCVKSSIDNSHLIDEKWRAKLQEQCSCENGGKCTASKLKADSFHCKCPAGYHGDRCESGPTSSLVLTVFLVCSFFIILAGAGVYLMLLAARRDRLRRGLRAQEGCDRMTLIEKDTEGEF